MASLNQSGNNSTKPATFKGTFIHGLSVDNPDHNSS